MPAFLNDIEDKFKVILSKKQISRNDLLELKSSIIEAYENDTIIDIERLQQSHRILTLNLYDVNE
jgi:hypothetical protein